MQFHRRRIAKTPFRAIVNPTDPEGPKSPDRTTVQNCMVFNLNLSQNRAIWAAGKPGTVLGRFWDLPIRDLWTTRSEGRPDRQDDEDDATDQDDEDEKDDKDDKDDHHHNDDHNDDHDDDHNHIDDDDDDHEDRDDRDDEDNRRGEDSIFSTAPQPQ